MDIPDKLHEIKVFLTNNRLKSILEQRPMTPVTSIKTDHISGQQSRHDVRKACGPRANQKVGMIGQKRPGVTRGFCAWKQIGYAIQQILSVLIVPEYVAAFNSTNDDMVQHPRSV